jgi:hypothetical protein
MRLRVRVFTMTILSARPLFAIFSHSANAYTLLLCTFSFQLPGDECSQKRFFDAILNGCIPVAKLLDDGKGMPRFVAWNCVVSFTYPFSQGSILGGRSKTTKAGIDMFGIVLTYDGECGFDCMRAPMERLLSNETALREHQLRLRDYAMLIGFGLSEESYEYPDAFMATMVSMRHKLWDRMGKIPASHLQLYNHSGDSLN